MHNNNLETHTNINTFVRHNRDDSFQRVLKSPVVLVLIFVILSIGGCDSSVTPTKIAVAITPTTIQVKASPTVTATVTPKPSPQPSSTSKPTATPTATPTQPPPTQEPVYYTVEQGDYAEKIAQMFGITVEELAIANGFAVDDVLSVGRVLLIPTLPAPTVQPEGTQQADATATPELVYVTVTHVVQKGETIDTIAALYGVTWQEIADVNGIEKDSILSIGQELTIVNVAKEPKNTTEPIVTVSNTPEPSQTGEPVTPEVAKVTYIVRKGDYIESIAESYGISVQQLSEANDITIDTILTVGQELVIPDQGEPAEPTRTSEPAQTVEPVTLVPADITYVVGSGDYLESIAASFGISAEELAEANGITVDSVLQVGQELIIPNQSVTVEPSSTPTLTPTSTPTAVTRSLPTPQPTVTGTKSFLYQQPMLLAPVNGATFENENASILLNWISVGILTNEEWYQVRIWNNDTQKAPLIYYTKATSWRPPVGFYTSDNAPYTIRWQVVVVGSVKADSTYDVISPLSTIYSFYWR
jgi:LysM repeat protein